MRRQTIIGLALWLLISSAHAATISQFGNFTSDDDRVLFYFSLSSSGPVTLQTISYAGRTTAQTTPFPYPLLIPAGGFDPILSLFDATTGALIATNDDYIGAPIDPASLAAYDSRLTGNFTAGDYVLALTQYFATPTGPNLSNGFSPSGTTGFFDFTNSPRTSFWAVDLIGISQLTRIDFIPALVPVPAAVWLIGGGLLGLLGLTRRKPQSA